MFSIFGLVWIIPIANFTLDSAIFALISAILALVNQYLVMKVEKKDLMIPIFLEKPNPQKLILIL